MTTNVAIITGMLIAGIVSDQLQKKTESVFEMWLPGIVSYRCCGHWPSCHCMVTKTYANGTTHSLAA